MTRQPATALPAERIERGILLLRGQKVMLDTDLAGLYEVETRSLVQAVKRNLDRFPDDFMFQLSADEYDTQFRVVFDAIRELLTPAVPPKTRRIGFPTEKPQS
jgi:hypothetical protein